MPSEDESVNIILGTVHKLARSCYVLTPFNAKAKPSKNKSDLSHLRNHFFHSTNHGLHCRHRSGSLGGRARLDKSVIRHRRG